MRKEDQVHITKTAEFVQKKFAGESSGHDWWHIYRVWRLSKHIANEEKGADLLVVELAALLHDIADWKFHGGDVEAGPKAAKQWLESINLDTKRLNHIEDIVRNTSFKGGTNKQSMATIEGKIVQDADRLDAIGAIGIARTFAFGGHFGRPMHDPAAKSQNYSSFDSFKKNLTEGSTINHFYEKLLLLKDKMNTKTAKKIALSRHKYMEQFLEEFYEEWDGKL
jgi:uncharacterized protein